MKRRARRDRARAAAAAMVLALLASAACGDAVRSPAGTEHGRRDFVLIVEVSAPAVAALHVELGATLLEHRARPGFIAHAAPGPDGGLILLAEHALEPGRIALADIVTDGACDARLVSAAAEDFSRIEATRVRLSCSPAR